MASRQGVQALTAHLDRETIACGLGQVQQVLVITTVALWIWNLAQERIAEARPPFNLYHADHDRWAVANDLCGCGTFEAWASVGSLAPTHPR